LKKAFLAFFNYGLPEVNSSKPLKLFDLKSLRSFGGTSMELTRSVLNKHAAKRPGKKY